MNHLRTLQKAVICVLSVYHETKCHLFTVDVSSGIMHLSEICSFVCPIRCKPKRDSSGAAPVCPDQHIYQVIHHVAAPNMAGVYVAAKSTTADAMLLVLCCITVCFPLCNCLGSCC